MIKALRCCQVWAWLVFDEQGVTQKGDDTDVLFEEDPIGGISIVHLSWQPCVRVSHPFFALFQAPQSSVRARMGATVMSLHNSQGSPYMLTGHEHGLLHRITEFLLRRVQRASEWAYTCTFTSL